MKQSSVQSSLISDGYAAFNSHDWDTVRTLFCADTPNAKGEIESPVWYPMKTDENPNPGPIHGIDAIIAHLDGLRGSGVKANLVGVADHGHKAITLDVTRGGTEAPHVCADEVEFDESGLIKSFRHCSIATHHEQDETTS